MSQKKIDQEAVCPCGGFEGADGKLFSDCCMPFIQGDAKPEFCEQLMRSRYTAYSMENVDYLIKTWHPLKQDQLSRVELLQSAKSTQWIRLEVVNSSQKGLCGTVEFKAWFKHKDLEGAGKEINCLHEVSQFEKIEDQWFYLDGEVDSSSQVKVGRNDPCPCGSGKKYKKCCA